MLSDKRTGRCSLVKPKDFLIFGQNKPGMIRGVGMQVEVPAKSEKGSGDEIVEMQSQEVKTELSSHHLCNCEEKNDQLIAFTTFHS